MAKRKGKQIVMSVNQTVANQNLVGVSPDFLNMMLYTVVGLVLALMAVCGVFIWYEVKKTSPNTRRLRKAINKGKTVLAISFDDGHVVLAGVDEVGAEGELRVKAKKQDFVFFAPRAPYDPDELVGGQLISMMTKGQSLDGRPFLVAYAGKTIATNIQTAAALNVPDDLVAIGQVGTELKPDVRANGGVPIVPEVIKPPEKNSRWSFHKLHIELFFALWPAIIKDLKSAFPKMYNQAQIRADERQAENTGWLKAKKHSGGKEYMPLIIILALVFGIIATLGLIMYFLK